jgi:hypothetical protein
MPKVSNEAIRAFNEGFEKCYQRIGGGKIAMDSTCIRELVRANPEVAYRTVEIYCFLAQSQPGYLQTAVIIATAYQVEFRDESLSKMVEERAHALGAEKHLEGIGFYADMDEARTEPPERAAARAWWQTSGKTDGRCDNCNRPMRRGEGYLIRGRAMMIDGKRIELGEELICQACFHQLRN